MILHECMLDSLFHQHVSPSFLLLTTCETRDRVKFQALILRTGKKKRTKKRRRKNEIRSKKEPCRRKAWIFRSNTWRERWTARNLPLNLENFLSDGYFSGPSGYYDPPLIIIISNYRYNWSIQIEIVKVKFPSKSIELISRFL